jgi:hypothetical protein
MTFEELISNPLVLLALGFFLSEWRSSRGEHTKSVQVDTDLKARVGAVEQWQRDHNSIHGCVRELAATTKAMSNTVDRLTRRLDTCMATNTPHRPARPFNFPGAREWIEDDEAQQ